MQFMLSCLFSKLFLLHLPKNNLCHTLVLHTFPQVSLNFQFHPFTHFLFELNLIVQGGYESGTKLLTILLSLGFCHIQNPHQHHVGTHSHTGVLQTSLFCLCNPSNCLSHLQTSTSLYAAQLCLFLWEHLKPPLLLGHFWAPILKGHPTVLSHGSVSWSQVTLKWEKCSFSKTMNLDIFMASHYFWQRYQHIRYSFSL